MIGLQKMNSKYTTIEFILGIILLGLLVGGCQPHSPALASGLETGSLFSLKTGVVDKKMAFIGVNGEIDGKVNPDIRVNVGEIAHIVLINGDGIPHNLEIPELGIKTNLVLDINQTVDVLVNTKESGTFAYYCTVSGHRQAGMEGRIIVSKP